MTTCSIVFISLRTRSRILGSLRKHDSKVKAGTPWKMNFYFHFLVRYSQEQFSSVNLRIYEIVEVLPLLLTSEFSKENFTSHNRVLLKTWKMLISRYFVEDGGETNQIV